MQDYYTHTFDLNSKTLHVEHLDWKGTTAAVGTPATHLPVNTGRVFVVGEEGVGVVGMGLWWWGWEVGAAGG